MEITIPDWVSINNYRTMTTEKKYMHQTGTKHFNMNG